MLVAEFPANEQLIRMLLAAPPPENAVLPASAQLAKVPWKAPPPQPFALKFPLRTQSVTNSFVDGQQTPAPSWEQAPLVRVNPVRLAPLVRQTHRRAELLRVLKPSMTVTAGPLTLWIARAFVTATRLVPPTNPGTALLPVL